MLKVTLSANAGVSIDFAGKRIWVDALHERKVLGFSSVSRKLFSELLNHEDFRNPDVICYTHCHPDHYSKKMTLEAASAWPNAKVITPESKVEGWHRVKGDRWEMTIDELRISYIQLPHEGETYANAVHYGIILSSNDQHIFLPGDCRIGSAELTMAIKDLSVDLAILDFPWISLPKARAFVNEYVRPKHICAYHLPFAEDDVIGYRAAALAAQRKMGDQVCLLMDPFQSVEY